MEHQGFCSFGAIYPHSSPEEQALRSPSGICEPFNKQVTIRHACYSEIGAAFYKRWNYHQRTYPISYRDTEEDIESTPENTVDESKKRAEIIVARMNLKEKHKKVLDCYLKGIGVVEIFKSLGIAYATVGDTECSCRIGISRLRDTEYSEKTPQK